MENSVINLSICIDDLKAGWKGKVKKANNGKLYISIDVRKRKEADQFGQDVYAVISQTKEEREAKADKHFVGSGRLITFNQSVADMAPASESELNILDDLPF